MTIATSSTLIGGKGGAGPSSLLHSKVETRIHDIIRELVSWECKEQGVKS